MQYLSELPQVSSIGVDGGIIELELEQEIEESPVFGINDPVVLTATYGGEIVVTAGQVIAHAYILGPVIRSRIKIKGSKVSFTI